MSNPTYPSRIDTWLTVVVGLTLGLQLFYGAEAYARGSEETLMHFGMLALILVLGRVLGYPCEYTLTPNHLLIRSGMIRLRIAYGEITAVEPSRSLWSAPALSLQRVKISYGRRFQLVSPKDREQFMLQLRARVTAVQAHKPLPDST